MHSLRGVLYAFCVLLIVLTLTTAVLIVITSMLNVIRSLDTQSVVLTGRNAADLRYLTASDSAVKQAAVAAVVLAVVGILITYFKHSSRR